jgi:hypothetical protein
MQLFEEKDNRFYVTESTIENAGLGLFAAEDLPAKSVLEVQGFLIEKNSPADICTKYSRDYRLYYDGERILVMTGWAAMANHSERSPNAVLLKSEDGQMYLVTLREVRKDEEILYKYSDYAGLQINMQVGGTSVAVLAEKDGKTHVKLVTVNPAKAFKLAEKLRGDGWTAQIVPAKIDLDELRGNL